MNRTRNVARERAQLIGMDRRRELDGIEENSFGGRFVYSASGEQDGFQPEVELRVDQRDRR